MNPNQMRFAKAVWTCFVGTLLFFNACSWVCFAIEIASSNDVLSSEATSGPVQLTVRVSPSKPRLSDLVDMEIDIKHESDVVIVPPVFGQSVGEFLVHSYGEQGKDRNGNKLGSNRRLFRYQLEPVHSGKHLIRSFSVEFQDNREGSEQKGVTARVESKPLELEVISEIGDAVPDLANLVPMQEPIPIRSSTAWVWIAALVMLATFFVGLLWATRKTPIKQNDAPKLSPEEMAQQELNKLLSDNLPAQGQVKEFFVRITGIVRTFIEGSTGIRAPEQTTEEFLREGRLEDVFSKEQTNQLKEFLEAADMVKYAGQDADPTQVESSIDRARGFIAIKFPSSPSLEHR